MVPSDLGLPDKFVSFNEGQEEIALELAASDRRFQLASIPTGGGKSIIYVAISRLLDARTLILTGTKGLQQQLIAEFASIGLVDIRGQNNYRCLAVDEGGPLAEYGKPGATCDDGPCHAGIECPLRSCGCLYYDAVARARDADLVVTNYAYWMTGSRFMGPDALGEFGLIVLDEAHGAPDQLADFCAVRLDAEEVKSLIGERLPPLNEGIEAWIDWATSALRVTRERYTRTKSDLTSIISEYRRRATRTLRKLTDLGHKLKELSLAHQWKRGEPSNPDVWVPGMQTDWIAESTPGGARFSPVWAHAYSEEYLFRAIPKVILMSATLQPAVARYLGLGSSDYDFREFTSVFDPRRRPLYYIPTTTVDRSMTEGQVRLWINRIDAIIDGRTDRKGIVHTRSYERAKLIKERSRHRALMLVHNSHNVREVVDQYKRSKVPCILVSPSMEEGYDFPHELCRYQIIVKVPFVDSRSPIIQARAKSDKVYLNYLTALSLIQMVGRGMRAKDDWCENFIIDDHIEWFWPAANKQQLFPNWFKKAYSRIATVPAARPLS